MADRPGDLGPIQIVVIACAGGSFDAGVLDQLGRLQVEEAVRLVDLLFVAKDRHGGIVEIEGADRLAEEAGAGGELVRALFGADGPMPDDSASTRDDVWFLADQIPAGTAAALAVLEHRWAAPLRDAIEAAEGHNFLDRWVHRDDLSPTGSEPG